MLPIERGIPIPPPGGKGGGRPRGSKDMIAWKSMQPGDSVLVPVAQPEFRPVIQARLMTNARRASDTFGHVFVTRAVEGGVRVWRTA